MFRILSSVDTLNKKMGVKLTHHNANWCITASSLRVKGTILKLGSLKLDSSCVFPKLTRAWTKIFWLSRVNGMMDFIAQHERGKQVGYLGFGSLF